MCTINSEFVIYISFKLTTLSFTILLLQSTVISNYPVNNSLGNNVLLKHVHNLIMKLFLVFAEIVIVSVSLIPLIDYNNVLFVKFISNIL